MKRKVIIPAIIVGLSLLSILVLWHQGVAAHPTLVYKGYDPFTALEHAKVMKLELRNTTERPIWFYGRDQSPFNPQITETPGQSPSRRIGTFAASPLTLPTRGQISKVAPNETVTLKWVVLDDGKPVRAGVAFYLGDFANDADFESHCLMLPPTNSTPWKDKIFYYWNKYYHARHLIAWPEPLTFQTENPPAPSDK